MSETYTLTDIINIYSKAYYFEYTLDSKNDELELDITQRGAGYTVDKFDIEAGEWYEEEMLTYGFEPVMPDAPDADDNEELGTEPRRVHDYKYVRRVYTLSLPPNRKRGDRYTAKQLFHMNTNTEFGDDVPGHGFSYINMPDDEELCEVMYDAT